MFLCPPSLVESVQLWMFRVISSVRSVPNGHYLFLWILFSEHVSKLQGGRPGFAPDTVLYYIFNSDDEVKIPVSSVSGVWRDNLRGCRHPECGGKICKAVSIWNVEEQFARLPASEVLRNNLQGCRHQKCWGTICKAAGIQSVEEQFARLPASEVLRNNLQGCRHPKCWGTISKAAGI